MRISNYTPEHIAQGLWKAESGATIVEFCRELGALGTGDVRCVGAHRV